MRFSLRKLFNMDHLPVLGAGVAISIILAMLYLYNASFLEFLDFKVYDHLLVNHYNSTTSNSVAIIDIDEKSLDEQGQWPWPRYRVALLLGKLSQAGAISVGLDILFAEPDRTSPIILGQQLKRDLGVDVRFAGLPKQLMDNDKILADLVRKGPYVPAFYFEFLKSAQNMEQCDIRPLNISVLRGRGAGKVTDYLLTATDVDCPLPELTDAAPFMGYYNTTTDFDGIVRKVPLLMSKQGKVYPSLALATLLRGIGQKTTILKVSQEGTESVRIGRRIVPMDHHGQLWVNYKGPARTFPYISATDILTGKFNKEDIKGKFLLIGTSAAGLLDIRATPFGPAYPGVEVHANVIDNILTSDYITRPTWVPGMELLSIFITGLLATFLLVAARAYWVAIILVALGTGIWQFTVWQFTSNKIFFSPTYAYVAMFITFSVLTLTKFLREEHQKRFLHSTFQSYLSPDLIEQMVESKASPELGGEARSITAYFTDIQSFSTFSEKLTAPQLVELLNEYLTAMTDILIEDSGTLDKYEGDAIIAFFGAPLDVPDHPYRACRVAIAMQNALLELREKWSAEIIAPGETDPNTKGYADDVWGAGHKWPRIVHSMKMRIGLNTGEIVVGNMGSSMRMNYTMMGDSVNLAARLEEGAKQYGVYTLASEYTLDAPCVDPETGENFTPRDRLAYRFLDNIQVVGKSEPVKVFELCALKDELSEQEEKLFELFNKGMEKYLSMQWDEAQELFTAAVEYERVPDGKTTPSEVYIKRCEHYRENPPVEPGQKWDGVYRLTHK